MTSKTIPISEFRTHVSRFVDDVSQFGGAITIIRNSRPTAVLVQNEEYENFLRWRKEEFWEGVDESFEEIKRGEGKSFDSVEDLIADLHSDDED